MKDKEVSATSIALRVQLQDRILKKIDVIRENVTLSKGSDQDGYLQMLLMVDEDLDDVLLNWEYNSIDPRFSKFSEDDLDDLDDDY